MKKIILTSIFTLCAISLFAQDADTIMTSAKNRITSDTISSQSRMVITAKNGSTTERVINQYSKDGPDGARTIIEFLSPANIKGSRFLTIKNKTGGTDQWIYLYELRRLRRINAENKGENFMGTDFSYDDISTMDRDISLDNHSLLREESLNGKQCYVIQSVPKDSGYQYSKTITWVDKQNYLIYKAEMYNENNKVSKIMEMSEFKDVQGRLSPMQTKISTVSAGTSTTIFMNKMEYDKPIPETVFTTNYLETGRY